MPKDEKIDSLINQLKDASIVTNQVNKSAEDAFTLPKEDVEQFVIDNASKLILESFDIMSNYKNMITTAPNAEDVGAYADLIKAATNTIESLNKIIVQDKKSKTTMTVKRMEMESKKELITHEADTKLISASREEIMKQLIEESKAGPVVDVYEDLQEVSDTGTRNLSS
tara:strand:+ start:571 stop:1077 length:507 start_codon:yes stop_codon:yes gene_type:complete